MGRRLLHLKWRNFIEVWVGWEDDPMLLEVKAEIGFFRRLWFALPIRWFKLSSFCDET